MSIYPGPHEVCCLRIRANSKFSANILVFFHRAVPFRHFPSVSGAISCNKVLFFPFLKFFPAKFYVPFLSCLCLVLVASETSLSLVFPESSTSPSRDHLPRKSREHPEEEPMYPPMHGGCCSPSIPAVEETRCKDTSILNNVFHQAWFFSKTTPSNINDKRGCCPSVMNPKSWTQNFWGLLYV